MSETSGFVFLYTTLPDAQAAQTIAAELVQAKLAACVNIHAPMTSVYEWESKLETGAEIPCFIKTREALVPKLMEALRRRHPYSVPAMLVIPIVGGNEDYLSWARVQTQA